VLSTIVPAISGKIAATIDKVLKPLVESGGRYEGKIKIIFRNQVQPWHHSSTLTHEAGLAAARVTPEKFWPYSLLLFQRQGEYYDIPTATLTAIQIRENLASLYAQLGVTKGEVDAFKDLLTHKSTPNGGVDVTDALKYTIKISRQNGIHVSPSVLWDGLYKSEIESSWKETEWNEFLARNVTA